MLSQLKKTGSSTASSILALKVALRGGKIAPCKIFERLTNSQARCFWTGPLLSFVHRPYDYDAVLNHCSSVFAAGDAGSLAISNIFGSVPPLQMMTVRNPLDRAISIYFWFGGQKRRWKQVPGVPSQLTEAQKKSWQGAPANLLAATM